MKHERQNVRNQILGPRALAVISCALALLAAQPLTGSSAKARETVASLKIAEGRGQLDPQDSHFKFAARPAADTPRQDRSIVSTLPRRSRLHILATVEMLQRMLAFELRPIERQAVPALLLEPVLVADLLIAPPRRTPAAESPQLSNPPREQRFAIEQCLLAPPVA